MLQVRNQALMRNLFKHWMSVCQTILKGVSSTNLKVKQCVQFCEQLRQYLWPALLRNSLSPYREAFQAVTRLLTSILTQPKLRAGLKVEINAFFPLMLLRPLEADK